MFASNRYNALPACSGSTMTPFAPFHWIVSTTSSRNGRLICKVHTKAAGLRFTAIVNRMWTRFLVTKRHRPCAVYVLWNHVEYSPLPLKTYRRIRADMCVHFCKTGLSVGVVALAGGVFPLGQHLLVGPPPACGQSWTHIKVRRHHMPSCQNKDPGDPRVPRTMV